MRALLVLSAGAAAIIACGEGSPAMPTYGGSDAAPPPTDAMRVDAAGDAGADAPPVCPNDFPRSCTEPKISYSKDIVPILKKNCAPCHYPGPGGIEDQRIDLSSYTNMSDNMTAIIGQVSSCLMPPTNGIPARGVPKWPAMPVDQRLTFFNWYVCGAQNN